jgi:hypothetical protein
MSLIDLFLQIDQQQFADRIFSEYGLAVLVLTAGNVALFMLWRGQLKYNQARDEKVLETANKWMEILIRLDTKIQNSPDMLNLVFNIEKLITENTHADREITKTLIAKIELLYDHVKNAR